MTFLSNNNKRETNIRQISKHKSKKTTVPHYDR
uniref:Uncharacterized protein n=1 Tax=Anguilla anguilla TaxID=7936 RepID=A0A0E9RTX0_ANGAN